MPAEIRLLQPGNEAILSRVAPEVFDDPIRPALAAEFLRDPRHHLAVAIEGDTVVGFASAVHYVHPDKPAQLWINEVGVAPAHRRQGIGRGLLQALFRRGRELGCSEAWGGTEKDNTAARRLYASLPESQPPAEFVMYAFRLRP